MTIRNWLPFLGLVGSLSAVPAEGLSAQRTITGRVTYVSGGPAVGVRVRAWDEDIGPDDLMGTAITDANGAYTIQYAGGHWDPAPHGITTWRPDIYMTVAVHLSTGWLRVHQGGTRDNHPHRDNLTRDLVVSPPPSIYGVVRSEENNNAPVPGALVKLYDFDYLSRNDPMGQAVTDDQGKYEIFYARKAWDLTNDTPDVMGDVFLGGVRQMTGPELIPEEDREEYNLTIPIRRRAQASEEKPPTNVERGTAGTNYVITNRSGETRYFYVNGQFVDPLFPGNQFTGHVPCNQQHILQAKDAMSETVSSVTWDMVVPGLCLAQVTTVFEQILF